MSRNNSALSRHAREGTRAVTSFIPYCDETPHACAEVFRSTYSHFYSYHADCPVKTKSGGCCVFPFIYHGKTYHRCSSWGANRGFCATKVDNCLNLVEWNDCGKWTFLTNKAAFQKSLLVHETSLLGFGWSLSHVRSCSHAAKIIGER